jgi:hypothetical protein
MNYSLVANNYLSRFQRERVIAKAMKKVMSLHKLYASWHNLPILGRSHICWQEDADAVKPLMVKFVIPTTALSGLTADSGSGTQELLANACKMIEI